MLYGSIVISYLIGAIDTGEFSPIEVIRMRNQRPELWNELFVIPGLADTDSNNIISFDEKVEAWKRMGLLDDKLVVMEGDKLPTPTTKQLERAVQSYR